jgi:hypothetical protein
VIPVADYTPEDLLDAARELLARPGARASGAWPRATAHLARQALEQTLEDFWRARLPALASAPKRIQLTALPTFLRDSEAAARAAYTWASLSNACHHHPYELAPSTSELTAWMISVEELRDAVRQSLAT